LTIETPTRGHAPLLKTETKMKRILIFAALLLLSTRLQAQVTMGSLDPPQSFSVLELISSGNKGMRLPQLTTTQRDEISTTHGNNPEMMGLQIFNIITGCVETWNGTGWISVCAPCTTFPPAPSLTSIQLSATSTTTVGDYPQYRWYAAVSGGSPLPASTILNAGDYWISAVEALYCESDRVKVTALDPIIVIPPEQGGAAWATYQWVGAFWRDNETGERIIASTNPNNYPWKVEIDAADGAGSWLTLDDNGGYDPLIWTATPHRCRGLPTACNSQNGNCRKNNRCSFPYRSNRYRQSNNKCCLQIP
jgi:hypothetical protein